MAYNSVLYPNMTVAEESHAGVAAISVLVSINDTEPSALGDLIQHVASIQFRGETNNSGAFGSNNATVARLQYLGFKVL